MPDEVDGRLVALARAEAKQLVLDAVSIAPPA
jgi:hypothetical protein